MNNKAPIGTSTDFKRASVKDISREFGVSESTAKRFGVKAREFYKKEPREIITIGQVKKANKLEL